MGDAWLCYPAHGNTCLPVTLKELCTLTLTFSARQYLSASHIKRAVHLDTNSQSTLTTFPLTKQQFDYSNGHSYGVKSRININSGP